MNSVIAYLSYSGNTEEVAAEISSELRKEGFEVDFHRIGIDLPINPELYDIVFLGTFTWDKGRVPEEVKDFILEVGYKPKNMAVFGTGDTQFGGEGIFCGAVDRLVSFFESDYEGLKIEQSPRGSQEALVKTWIGKVIEDVKIRKSKNIRTAILK